MTVKGTSRKDKKNKKKQLVRNGVDDAFIFHLEAEIEKDLTHSEWCILSQLGEECENDLPLEHTMESLKKDFGG